MAQTEASVWSVLNASGGNDDARSGCAGIASGAAAKEASSRSTRNEPIRIPAWLRSEEERGAA